MLSLFRRPRRYCARSAMTVLVTPRAGFVGSHLTESRLRDGYAVVDIYRFNDNDARPDTLRTRVSAIASCHVGAP
jgi:nucleoside-diphosphate-sugar epimerase